MENSEKSDLWEPVIQSETRPDGSILVWNEEPLDRYPRCMTERFMHWAETVPERVWMAERGPAREMIEITYGEAAKQIRQLAAEVGLAVEIKGAKKRRGRPRKSSVSSSEDASR